MPRYSIVQRSVFLMLALLMVAILVWGWMLGRPPGGVSLNGAWDATWVGEPVGQMRKQVVPFFATQSPDQVKRELVLSRTITLDRTFERPSLFISQLHQQLDLVWDGETIRTDRGGATEVSDGSSFALVVDIPAHLAGVGDHTVQITLRGGFGQIGITKSVILGEHRELLEHRIHALISVSMILLIVVLSGGINLLVFLLRPNLRVFLWTGLLLLGIAAFIFTDGAVWYQLFADKGWRIRFGACVDALLLAIAMLTMASYLNRSLTKLESVLVGVLCTVACVSLVLPTRWYYYQDALVNGFIILVCGLIIWNLINGAVSGNRFIRNVVLVGFPAVLGGVANVLWFYINGTQHFITMPVFAYVGLGLTTLLIVSQADFAIRYGQWAEKARDAILVVRVDGTILERNPSATIMFGATSESLFDHVNEQDSVAIRTYLAEGTSGRRLEMQVSVREGHTTFLESAAVDITERERLLILRDISERRELEMRLLGAARLETVELVATGIVHDLKNTLAAAMGQVEILRWNLEGQQRDVMDRLYSLLLGSARVVNRIMTLVQHPTTSTSPVSPLDLVTEAMELVSVMMPNNIEIHINADEVVPDVLVRPGSIEQVLLNLFMNAKDALAGQDGNIWVELCGPSDSTGDSMVRICVEDDGPGVPKTIESHIWQSFFTTKSQGRGSGIGLSVARRLVNDQGGKLEYVDAQHASGARFEMVLPLHVATSEKASIDEQSLRVLIVEQGVDMSTLIEGILMERDCQVCACSDVDAARNAFAVGAFDVLIVGDLGVAQSGMRFALDLFDQDPQMGVLLVQGYSPVDHPMVRQGWCFLVTPFTPEQLVAASRRAFFERAHVASSVTS